MEGITFWDDCPFSTGILSIFLSNENQSCENQMLFEVRTTLFIFERWLKYTWVHFYTLILSVSTTCICYIYNFLGLRPTKLYTVERDSDLFYYCWQYLLSVSLKNQQQLRCDLLSFVIYPASSNDCRFWIMSAVCIHTIIRSFTAMS